MRYLLDTHAFIWLDGSPMKLSSTATEICKDPTQQLILSIASVWEMQIKIGLRKLILRAPLAQIITEQHETNHIQLLTVELSHILALESLPDHHKDPFDRLLIAQAQKESLTLLTNDPAISKYPVSVMW